MAGKISEIVNPAVQPFGAEDRLEIAQKDEFGVWFTRYVLPSELGGTGDDDWTYPTLLNGWVAWSGQIEDFPTARYRKDSNGIVHLSGMINGANRTGNIPFILPVGYRPDHGRLLFAAIADGAIARIDVHGTDATSNQGAVILSTPTVLTSWVSLEGVHFYAAAA